MAEQKRVSASTQELMQALMKECNVSHYQQRIYNKMMRGKNGLSQESVHITGERVEESKKKITNQASPNQRVLVRPTSDATGNVRTHLRTKAAIEATGAYNLPEYVPRPAKFNSSVEKERLQALMTTNGEKDNFNPEPKQQMPQEQYEQELDELSTLMEEVKERNEWLQSMRSLGKSQPFEAKIQFETTMRMNRIKELMLERAKQ